MTYDELRGFLKANSIKHTVDTWSNKGCDPEVPWNIIRIGDDISVFFAMGRMFKICFKNKFTGSLKNGIHIGMTISEAKLIDDSLLFDEDEELYSSSAGYWLEDNIETQCVECITVFIKELLDDDLFFSYQWAENK